MSPFGNMFYFALTLQTFFFEFCFGSKERDRMYQILKPRQPGTESKKPSNSLFSENTSISMQCFHCCNNKSNHDTSKSVSSQPSHTGWRMTAPKAFGYLPECVLLS